MLYLAVALDVVLAAYKVPHEVAPVHEVDLIVDEELDVVPLCGYLDPLLLAANVDGSLTALDAAHPVIVEVDGGASGRPVGMVGTVHTGEEHRGLHHVLVLGANYNILVLFIGRSLLLRHIYLGSLLHYRHPVLAFHLTGYLRGVGAAIEERCVAILLAVEVTAEGEDILR